MNLPNALTVLRLLLVPVFAWLYTTGEIHLALGVYALAALTDALDGYLARKLKQITAFGKLVDPVADKLMLLTMLGCLASTGQVPWWLLGGLIVKELYLMIGSLLLLRRKIVVQANMFGKVATFLGVAAILCLYPWHDIAALTTAGRVLLVISLALAVWSVVAYTVSALRVVRQGSESA